MIPEAGLPLVWGEGGTVCKMAQIMLMPSWVTTPNWIEFATLGGGLLLAIFGVWRWWIGYRRKTLLVVKPIRNFWESNAADQYRRWLNIELEFSARKPYQVSYIEAMIGGRHCDAETKLITLVKRKEKHTIRFPVPHDIVEQINYGHITMEFGGTGFRTDVFIVRPMSSKPSDVRWSD